MTQFSIELKEFPPSINKLYFSLPHGGKAMTKEGVRFQHLVVSQISKAWGPELAKFDNTKPYAVSVTVFFPEIFNKGWPDKASQRFKKRDATNLIKLLEDTLAKAIGVDDANFVRFSITKWKDEENPRIIINIRELKEADLEYHGGDESN